MKYYAHINSKDVMTGIDMSQLSADEYGSTDVKNIQVTEDIYNHREMYIYQDGEIIIDPLFNDKQAVKFKEEMVNQIYEIKAERAYGGVFINGVLKFETNQTSITNTVASLALMKDDSVANWKFYMNDVPTTILITKLQLAGIAQFAQDMINKCFKIEGEANERLAECTTEQLIDEEFRTQYIETVKAEMEKVNNQLLVEFAQPNEVEAE